MCQLEFYNDYGEEEEVVIASGLPLEHGEKGSLECLITNQEKNISDQKKNTQCENAFIRVLGTIHPGTILSFFSFKRPITEKSSGKLFYCNQGKILESIVKSKK